MKRVLLFLVAVLFAAGVPCTAQQEGGDVEVGLAGNVLMNHTNFGGSAFTQFTFGSYTSRGNFVRIIASPTFSFSRGNTTVGGFLGAGYRRMLGATSSTVQPFVGVSGGGFAQGGSGISNLIGSGMGEIGFKKFVSQKTAFEISYQLLYLQPTGGGGSFAQRTNSQVLFGFTFLL
jgi:hypothetical protein